MINLTRASIAGRKRTVAPPPPPPPGRFDITTLFGAGDDGIFLAPSHLASLRKRINGEEPTVAADDLIGVAINLQNRLALGPQLITDPALAASTGWTGQIGGAGEWSFASGAFSIAAATAGKTVNHESRGVVGGALYDFQLDLTRTAGAFGIRLGSTSVITNTSKYSASGNYVWSLVAASSLDTIRVMAVDGGTAGSFSRISVKRYLGRYGRASSDITRPILKQDGDAWYFSRPGSESLKLWGGALSGCTVCYTTEGGVTLLENQTVGVDYELLKGARTYGIVVINRTLTTQEKADLQTEMALLSTSGVNLPDPGSVPAWVSLGSTSNATFRHFIEGPTQYNFRATGANAVVYTFASANVAAQTVTWATQGLTTPVVVEIQGAALVDPLVTHLALGGNGLNGSFPDISQMTGLSQLYMAKNAKAAVIPSIGALSNLATFWAHDNGATGWGGSAVPESLKDLKLYGNAFNQATVDAILAQCDAASLGAGVSIDVGGTNANPSSAGWASRDALIARGATVVVSGEDPRGGIPAGFVWRPGHYILLGNDSNELASRITELATYTAVRGYQKRFDWVEIETAKDVYSFTTINDMLDRCEAAGKTLILQLQYKNFAGNNTRYPSYMRNTTHLFSDADGTLNIRLWEPALRARLSALITAVAAEVGEHPGFGGFVLPESTTKPPVDPDCLETDTYYKNEMAKQHALFGAVMRAAFPNHPTATYFNGGSTHVPFYDSSAASGNALGGPDTYVGTFANSCFLSSSYSLFGQKAGAVPIMMSIQQNNFRWTCPSSAYLYSPGGLVPIADLYSFARNTLKANYVSWLAATSLVSPSVWTSLKAFLKSLETTYPGDPAGGLPSAFPTLLKE